MEIKKKFNQICRQILLVILATLIWMISLPSTSVQADGYYSDKPHKTERTSRYYTNKQRNLELSETNRPYYSTKERSREKALKDAAEARERYVENGQRTGEVISPDVETRNRQRN